MIAAPLFVAALAAAQTPSPAPADWLRATARVVTPDAGALQVGEPFTFVIEAEHAPGGVALLPEELPLDARFAERKAERRHLRSGSGDVERDRYELELIAFESGELELPPIPLAYGSTRTATPRVKISVATGFTDDELPVASSTRAEAMGELDKMAAADPPPQVVWVDDYTLLWVAGALVVLGLAGVFG
ncbi:hypothetical protein L6R52_42155, partial [Myxococcota bacterium]|nr:hypothetical protein [Myxococcota bacterium]